jgi:DNA polymerase-3 subunit delta'
MTALPPWFQTEWSVHARRLAEGRVPHALLAAAPAGFGKRLLVDAMVASLLCLERRPDGHACGRCRGCSWRLAGTHPDLLRIGIAEDATQVTVGQVRALGERLALAPQPGGRQVAVIDPADEMNPNAANALLKTLEEPTPHSVLVLVADQPARLLPTILSRCQRMAASAPHQAEALEWLIARGVDGAAADAMLSIARGNPGEAERLAQPEALKLARDTLTDFAAVIEGRKGVVDVAAEWARDRPAERLDWLSQSTSLAVWSTAVRPPELLAPLAALTEGADFNNLADWWVRLNRVRALLRTPVRTDLLIAENLAEARRVCGARGSVGAPRR